MELAKQLGNVSQACKIMGYSGGTPLRFFFVVTLGRSEAMERMPFVREPRKLPVVLSPEEVARFPEAAPGLEYRARVFMFRGACKVLRQR